VLALLGCTQVDRHELGSLVMRDGGESATRSAPELDAAPVSELEPATPNDAGQDRADGARTLPEASAWPPRRPDEDEHSDEESELDEVDAEPDSEDRGALDES